MRSDGIFFRGSSGEKKKGGGGKVLCTYLLDAHGTSSTYMVACVLFFLLFVGKMGTSVINVSGPSWLLLSGCKDGQVRAPGQGRADVGMEILTMVVSSCSLLVLEKVSFFFFSPSCLGFSIVLE